MRRRRRYPSRPRPLARKSDAASRVEPRAQPADRAIAVYGVVPAAFAGRRFVVEGRRTVVVRSGNVGLVANYVDPVEFSPAELERRRADRQWLRERARYQERVLDRLRARGSVLPTPLLTTYEDVAALATAAQKSGSRWSRALARVSGKVEYGLHAFEGPHVLPEPEPYQLRVSLRVRRERAAPRAARGPVGEHLQRLWDACAASAFAVRRFDAPGLRGFALGAALLIGEEADTMLRMALSALEPAGHALGVTVYLEGPRLPYTFG